jgi:hypothetical protein
MVAVDSPVFSAKALMVNPALSLAALILTADTPSVL